MNIQIISSGKNQKTQWVEIEKAKDRPEVEPVVINRQKSYQEMIGFGGAFTEAAAYTLSRISPEKRQEAIESYFHQEKGLGYNIGRVAIHSCDFALGNYTYINEGDEDLSSFSLEHEEKWVFPLISDAENVRGNIIQLLASPWSPPGWMKDTGIMNHGGKLLPRYRNLWARYFVKYVQEMRKRGMNLWGVTVQNEPAAVQTWDSCIYTEWEERDFIRDHLGPAFHSNGLEDVKILIWDHNRDIIIPRAKAILEDEEAAQFVWGTGFHWYVSEEFENVGEVHNLFPDKHLLFTEGCQEGGVHLGSWETGERYARNMIGDFNNWCEGYLDWNLVLDETGGPNHVGNLCDAPIIADTTTDELHYNSSYYYIGHFSRHVQAGARRIAMEGKLPVPAVSFANPDGSLVSVLLNEKEETVSYSLNFGEGQICGELAPRSIHTVISRPGDK